MHQFVAKQVLILTLSGLIFLSVEGSDGFKSCTPVYHEDARDEILKFFEVSDGYDITWLHAVNSPEKLTQGLTGDTLMLEADVLMRNNIINGTPVMAHPPDVDSNLTLYQFLTRTIGTSKGMKLDFKTIVVVEPSLKMIKNVTSGQDVENPIWLNADIFPGPCYDRMCVPVDPDRFLSLCQRYFPNATLSISWTTGYNVTPAQNFYNWSQALSMGKLVSQISQPITFPIRAYLVQRSWKQLHWLLDLSKTFTVTIWSAERDNVDVQDLVSLRDSVKDKRRIYYDLPPGQSKDFKQALDSSTLPPKEDSRATFAWNPKAATKCEDVLVGENSVMFSGDGGYVLSKEAISEDKDLESFVVSGVVSFIAIGSSNKKTSINVTLGAETSMEKATLTLHNDGTFQVFTGSGEDEEGSLVRSNDRVFKLSIEGKFSDGELTSLKFKITGFYGEDMVTSTSSLTVETGSKREGNYLVIGSNPQSEAILVQDVEVFLKEAVTGGCGIANCSICMSAFLLLALVAFLCQI